MQFYSFCVAASIFICLSTILVVVIIFKSQHSSYWPSISEAGAGHNRHKIYSTGMTVGAIFMLLGAYSFIIICMSRLSKIKESVGVLFSLYLLSGTVIMCAALAIQGIIKINMSTDSCPHRTAASVFFVSAIFMCLGYTSLYNRVFKVTNIRVFLRWVSFIAIALDIFMQTQIFKQYNLHLSSTNRIRSMDNSFITKFSILQYVFVSALFLCFATIANFK
ncbi:Transmembrane_domain-containing protein [Hexamita inflata]|uniref:Transmembrane domain-containing protein n=1 Tax=Hexamita inflata TaxID=28002 RepID=A0AA86TGG4_9EUKA|nr:Transmembrane domain-containing protein [Hexamita inflata]